MDSSKQLFWFLLITIVVGSLLYFSANQNSTRPRARPPAHERYAQPAGSLQTTNDPQGDESSRSHRTAHDGEIGLTPNGTPGIKTGPTVVTTDEKADFKLGL